MSQKLLFAAIAALALVTMSLLVALGIYPAEAPPTPSLNTESGPDVKKSCDTGSTGDAGSGDGSRVEVPIPASGEAVELAPWDSSRLTKDPYWSVPTDLRQFMHMTLNNSALMRGDMVPPGYSCALRDLAHDSRVNPDGISLTDDEALELERLLAGDHEVLQEMGKEEWRLKGVAFHQAVERGCYFDVGEVDVTSRTGLSTKEAATRMQPLMDQEEQLRQMFGERFTDYCTTVCGGPPPDLKRTYIVYILRKDSPKAFEIYEEAIKVKSHANETARRYFASRRR